MSEANDRGTKKWTAMMMPEHERMLKQLRSEDEYKEKPILSEYQKAEIDTVLQLALKDDLTVELEHFKNKDYHKIKGKLLTVDVLNKCLKIDEAIIPLDNITGAWID
ncbi:YolD-like protein [Virgibacillus subterraneus]|uniref:YolD-like protein n=1 Tax=Virgibacillus subterraneus TaxID=621109 RepID=A0A1H9KLK7_9BACI|nr:YolD-like family protein [Virgibacillus subterraneus]SER00036.1 YolD-like protein [Virgibacillus subterraneus]